MPCGIIITIMATTTSSSKKKTTTTTRTKKSTPTAGGKKSASAAKTTKKTVTKKTTAKKAPAKKVAASKTSKTAKTAKVDAPAAKKTSKVRDMFAKLNMWNWVMAVLHAAQGVAVIALSNDALFPVSTTFMTQDTLASSEGAPVLVQAQRSLFDVNLAYLVAAFFFMSAIAHLIVATVYRKRYESDLKVGVNKVRWFEYGISASTMMVAIAMLVGVSDISTLLLIFGGTLVMNLCGLVMEIHNQTTKKTNWLSYWVGTIAGLIPWLVIATYLGGIYRYGEGNPPTFVLWIFVSIFVFFSSFAVNMVLQYKGIGKWKDYLYGERAYMILSLVAKAALAWQVFGGTLRP